MAAQSILSMYWLTLIASSAGLAISVLHREFGVHRLAKILGAAWLVMSFLTLAAYGYHASRQAQYCLMQMQQQQQRVRQPVEPAEEMAYPQAADSGRRFTVSLHEGKQYQVRGRRDE